MEKHFYVYYSYEPWGRGYIGKRECLCLPEEDVKYFGSFRDKTFKPTEKIILELFDSRESALEAEIVLHNFYQVDINHHFANKAKQTSKHFECRTYGENNPAKRPECRKRISETKLGENNPAKRPEVREKLRLAAKNKKGVSQETRDKMSKSHKGKPPTRGMLGKKHTQETKNNLKEQAVMRNNKTHYLKDPDGNIFTFNDIRAFSVEKNLCESAVGMVLRGKRVHHKGWTRA